MLNKMKWLVLIAVGLSTTACCGKPADSISFGSNPSQVLATVNDTPITKKDVLAEIKPQMKRIESELYKLEKSGVEQMIDKKLIEQAAIKEGKNPDTFLAEYFKENLKEPTEEEIKKYYEFRKEKMGDKKYDEVKSSIAEFLKSNQQNALNRKLIRKLRADAKIDIKLEPPRVEIEIGNSPTLGPKNAPITIVEFSDYQCPFCSRVRPTVNQILETYPKEVLYVFKDFPLGFHKDAPKAHEAAHCAGDQGKYWEMNKQLFANQRAISIDDLNKYAKNIGLDVKKFDKCLSEGKYAKQVSHDTMYGGQVGVTGTPAFFVNGIMISGARPFASFKEVIDQELSGKK